MLSDNVKRSLEQELPVIMDFLDVTSALRISGRTLYRLIQQNELPAWKDEEGEWNILRQDVINYLDKHSDT